jgi:hypothetical protein
MNHGATRHFGIEPQAFLGSFEMLVENMQVRNRAVHMTEPPSNRDAATVIEATKTFLAQFDSKK